MLDAVFNTMTIEVEPFSLCELAPRGWLDMPKSGLASLHYVLAGEGALHVASRAPHPIGAGDLVLVPAADRHAIGASDGRFMSFANCQPAGLGLAHHRGGERGDPDGLVVLCARVSLGLQGAGQVIDLLRSPVIARSGDRERDHALIELVLAEIASPRPGSMAQIKALLLFLIIDTLRRGAERRDQSTGWLVALADVGLWPALAAVLAAPGADHSVESLGELVGMSRARFAARFKESFGVGPMQMVKELRLQHAARLLIEGRVGVARVAELVGYSSRSHFTQQFEARYGVSPARYGRQVTEA
jgi:AraC-like DNA-binding protein